MGLAVNPWSVLRSRRDVVLRWGRLRGADGRVIDRGDHFELILDSRLGRVERRCVLMHELVHIERGAELLYTRATPRPLVDKAEAIVDRQVARLLVPLEELAAFTLMLVESGDAVTVLEVATEFDVTEHVARTALHLLHQDLLRRAA